MGRDPDKTNARALEWRTSCRSLRTPAESTENQRLDGRLAGLSLNCVVRRETQDSPGGASLEHRILRTAFLLTEPLH